ncbi:MAG: transcription antitermination factor NusB [Elusimicrobiota bacterium]|nr:transcription antitermination factor NusB [Elusimicrobiota bacterium]
MFISINGENMSGRRSARENALQMLYSADNCSMTVEEIAYCFSEYLPQEEAYKNFALELFNGVLKNKELIDGLIVKYTQNWDMKRMAAVDRNTLRLAAYEIVYTPATPINVIIDEAVEISKLYSTKDSSKFVNGILDKLKVERVDPAL